MMATLRNRRALVASVEPFDAGPDGRLHLVRVEYTDLDGVPEDAVLWEREQGATLLEPTTLPQVSGSAPMIHAEYDALLRATRWSAITPFLSPDGSGELSELPISSPFHGAIQVDDFQLVPLLQALQMPRVSLLLADDVGLGKTIEAGLVLTELLIRRRIRRVLIICPASLRNQWRQEMEQKFALSFDIVDRPETHALQKRLGLHANPWRVFPRVATSYHYLRQPDVLEQFLSTCRPTDPDAPLAAQLPWDLLVVDEAHNLMPSNFGDDSDLTKMLRSITPYFEHKLFLTATPHNGHTRSFSGLLELLDPVRFTQTSDFSDDEKARVETVVVRRLKREINELDDRLKRPRRFAERYLVPVPLYFHREEKLLAEAVESFRKKVKTLIAASSRTEQLAGSFAVEVLNKRLLSCPYTFGESWCRFKNGLSEEEAADSEEVAAAKRASEADIDDDREREDRTRHAVRTVGAWLKPLVTTLQEHISAIDTTLQHLGIAWRDDSPTDPKKDSRLDRVIELINKHLRRDRQWLDDERLVIFTEYKTTLDYLERRLKAAFEDDGERIRILYGGMDQADRDLIRDAFNDPNDPIRILIATDAASEGLNLQETARLMLHFDIPWNPSRLEQRNGRLDRHGQARDVSVHHFASEDDADLKFLGHVVKKVETIREDLGSMGEVFDAAFARRFVDLEDSDRVISGLDRDVETNRNRAEVPRKKNMSTGEQEKSRLEQMCREIDLTPETLRSTLEIALGLGIGMRCLEGPDERGRFKLGHRPPKWESLINDSVRLKGKSGVPGPMPGLIFDPLLFVQRNNGRPVFRPAKDTVLLHLGHPMFRHALVTYARARFPGAGGDFAASRWCVRHGDVPAGTDALVLLTVEELGVNELREPFHHWVRTIQIPVKGGELKNPLPHVVPAACSSGAAPAGDRAVKRAKDLWEEIDPDLATMLKSETERLTTLVRAHMEKRFKVAAVEEKKTFDHRQKEIERLMSENNIKKLEKERDKLLAVMKQQELFAPQVRDQEERLRDLEEELKRRRSHYQDLLDRLKIERKRVLEQILPQRYSLRGKVQVFPVAVEILLPREVRP
ncbi:DISARM system SNF2-like helicase DrmD [bacterium]|nr:DISARM system SNF2-like helicase DrmD [bacterium]